jgi:hypothetical protein
LDSTESGAYFRHYCALDYAASKMRAACRMTRWIDPDRPQELTREETLSVNQDPVVRCLVAEREKWKRRFRGTATQLSPPWFNC